MAQAKAVTRSDTAVPSLVDPAQALSASKVLIDYIKKTEKEGLAKSGKKNLLVAAADEVDEEAAAGGDTPIWLTVSTKRHILDDARKLQPVKITVPHPLNTDEDTTICLITADPQRAFKDLVASSEFPEPLRKRITRVVDLTHLTKKFKTYEAQRKLFAEHDVFLGDDRIINRLPKALGKTFYRSTVKRPVPVVLAKSRPRGPDGKRVKAEKKKGSDRKDDEKEQAVADALAKAKTPAQIAAEIQTAVGSAVVHLAPTTNTAIRVGQAGWPAAHVAANVEAVAREFVARYVGAQKWHNVKAIYLKGAKTMALPIWQTDELWLEGAGKDVLQNGSAELAALEAKQAARREKANVGKKRKAITEEEEGDKEEEAEKPAVADKKGKKSGNTKKGSKDGRPAKKAKQALPASSDGGLDKQIAAHKEKLKKQKSAAKKAMDI